MLINEVIFFFLPTLVPSKIWFKLHWFSNILKHKIKIKNSFRTSISWQSDLISSPYLTWLSTLKKIKTKIYLKKLINKLLISKNWLSFSEQDILNSKQWNFLILQKILKDFSSKNENIPSLFTTTKTINKILNNFWNNNLLNIKKSFNFFIEKYFLKEKYARAVSLSNNFKLYLFKLFTYFLPSKWLLKYYLLKKNKFSLILKLRDLFFFRNLFKNKLYFIIFPINFDENKIYLFLNKFLKILAVIELTIFSNGYFVNKNFQHCFLISNLEIYTNKIDVNFTNFFTKIFTNTSKFKKIINFSSATNSCYFNFLNIFIYINKNNYLLIFKLLIFKLLIFKLLIFKLLIFYLKNCLINFNILN